MKETNNNLKRRVLIVCNDKVLYDYFVQALDDDAGADGSCCDGSTGRLLRYDVDWVVHGESAATKVRDAMEQGRPYLIAFLDVLLGQPGCIDTLAAICGEAPRLEVVVCTAYGTRTQSEIVKRVDSSRCLIMEKPPNVEIVRQLAASLTEKAQLVGQATLNEELRREIARREATEASLRQSEMRCRELYAKTPAVLHSVDKDLRIIEVSDHWLELMGYRRDEVIGRKVTEFLTEESRVLAKSRSIPAFKRDGRAEEFPYQFVKKTGEKIDVLLSAVAQRDGEGKFARGLAVLTDVTEKLRTEKQLQLQSIALESAANAIVIGDGDGRITWVNSAFVDLTGYSREECIGRELRALARPEEQDSYDENIWQHVKNAEVWKGKTTARHKDGSDYTEQQTITPLCDAQGDVISFVAIKEDITERMRLECELRSAHKLESMGQLAAGIAHEINTPIQYIGDNTRFLEDSFSGLLDVVKSHQQLLLHLEKGPLLAAMTTAAKNVLEQSDAEYLLEEVPRAIEQSLDGIGRVAEIVRAMKELSCPASERKSEISLNHAIENAITVARNTWSEIADVRTDLASDLPRVPCLRAEINQVLLHLIVNAAHAIESAVGDGSNGRGTISVSTRQVDGSVEIQVCDTGIGMTETVRTHVFDPFFTTKEVGKGSGQGLTIVYSTVVDKHGGGIDVESKLGVGTTFTIRLPLSSPSTIEEAIT